MGFQLPSCLLPARRPASFSEHDYLIGVRGILVIQSFLWVFLQTFVPTTVKDSDNVSGPLYQVIIRKTLSVLFWNDALIYSSFIFLSARTLCLPFLKNPTRVTASSSIFRRGVRLWFPTTVAFSLSTLLFHTLGISYISAFIDGTNNLSIGVPRQIPSFLNWFNSLFEIFWVSKKESLQAANTAFPAQTLWMVSVIFMQSYTVYMTMVTLPYTRPAWRVKALLFFVITAWWVQSWAWYSVSGLLLADAVVNMDFKALSARGLKLPMARSFRLPYSVFYGVLMAAGIVMQYLWTAWRPDYEDMELRGHTGLYNSGPLNMGDDVDLPQARDDNYLIIIGFFLLLETHDWLQTIFRTPFFVYLGRRSLSYFLIQPIIVYTAGIKLFTHLHFSLHWAYASSTFTCLLACLPLVVVSVEIWYRIVDYPAAAFAMMAWDWVRK
ncbi:hypothetical protein K432DRAFT_304700 [Lepidopterella palustris CBS 459.81]|uniref:Acyltransferase 3 domain-containing protein n=1 Tax=Lepidopterella palustris CBS 459.81 TaxID=1314670 RepID=A0A8E2E4G9_9PEZI|nr:hypothetical protein K432DRAFT_304700 [Lepidopterella palustris CBS 459.81]